MRKNAHNYRLPGNVIDLAVKPLLGIKLFEFNAVNGLVNNGELTTEKKKKKLNIMKIKIPK